MGRSDDATDMTPSLDVLEGLLSFYVRSVSYALSRALDLQLKGHEVARGSGKITALLMIDATPGIRPSDIAVATLRDRPSVSRVIATLVRTGLIEQRTSSVERRAYELFITPRGRAEAETVRQLIRKQSDAFFGALSEADRVHLMRILGGLYNDIRRTPA